MPRLAAFLCLLATAGLVACGGDKTMTVKEYRSAAKKVCLDGRKATDVIKQPTKATGPAIADYFSRLLKANDQTTKRFQKLDPPKKLAAAHKDALNANQAAIDEVRKIVDQLNKGTDPRTVLTGAQTRLQDLSKRSSDAAQRLGVPECADR